MIYLTSSCLFLLGTLLRLADVRGHWLRFHLQGPGPLFECHDCEQILGSEEKYQAWKESLASKLQ